MATHIELLKAEIARIESELAERKRRLAEVEKRPETTGQEKRPFAQLRGLWKGATFTYEEIKAAEYKFDEEDWA